MNLKHEIEQFLLACRAERKAPKTMRAYHDILADFLDHMGDIDPRELKPADVQQYIVDLFERPGRRSEKISSSTAMKYYTVIRTFIRWMYAQEIITKRITDYTKPPRLSKDLPDGLSDEEVDDLFRYLNEKNNFRNKTIFELFLDTGLRLEEVCNLNVNDIHIEDAWLKVFGKGQKEAIVPFGYRLSKHLHKYFHDYRNALPGEDAFFVKEDGERLGYEGLAIMIRRTLSDVRKEGKCGAHTLRHTFATKYLRNGGSLEALRKILRHNDIKVTQRYVHLVTEDVKRDHRKASPLDSYPK
jgi:site-specific recombinase XerD